MVELIQNFNIQQLWADFGVGLINILKTINLIDVLDIIVLTWVIYKGIQIVRDTRAGQLVKGIALLAVLFIVSNGLGLKSMSFLLTNVFQIGVIALLVVFQPELRRALERIGRAQVTSVIPGLNVNNEENQQIDRISQMIASVVDASVTMSAERTGAIMVFERKTKLGDIISTGTVVEATPSAPLIGNIFFHNSPLHDGAMILRAGSIHAAGCFLPLSENDSISRQLGTRHRAALGMSENSDALVVVISEETGYISYALNGVLTRDIDAVMLRQKLEECLLPEKHDTEGKKDKDAAKRESRKREIAKKGKKE